MSCKYNTFRAKTEKTAAWFRRHHNLNSQCNKFVQDEMSSILFLLYTVKICPWWRHQTETYSALHALCAWIHRSHGPHKGQWRGDIFIDLYLNKAFSKQSKHWWFETPSYSLWRHCNAMDFIHSAKRCLIKGIKNGWLCTVDIRDMLGCAVAQT